MNHQEISYAVDGTHSEHQMMIFSMIYSIRSIITWNRI